MIKIAFCLLLLCISSPLLVLSQTCNDLTSCEGFRVRGEGTQEVYLVLNSVLRHIITQQDLINLSVDGFIIVDLPQDVISTMPIGPDLVDGTFILINEGNSIIYLYDTCYPDVACKRWIRDPPTFQLYQFDRSKARTLSDDEINALPNGEAIWYKERDEPTDEEPEEQEEEV